MSTAPSPWWRVRRAWVLPFVVGSSLVTLLVAAAVAAFETDTVESFWGGIWWAISLVTTVGFVGAPPTSTAGQVLSAVLMVLGFVLLAMVSAALASLFVHEDEAPRDAREERTEDAILTSLSELRTLLRDAGTPPRPVPPRRNRLGSPSRPTRGRRLRGSVRRQGAALGDAAGISA